MLWNRDLVSCAIATGLLLAGLGGSVAGVTPYAEAIVQASNNKPSGTAPSLEHGRQVWFNNTYGDEKFFTFLAHHPDPEKRIELAFQQVVTTPRAMRFDVWGVINDPDCRANPNGGADLCPDPHATGVIGIRKFEGQGGTMYGVACASCHVGFDPLNPPKDPNAPGWQNIHPTIGDQYGRFGQIFAANLPPVDPRRFLFAAWPDGTVDTTLLFTDHIMNPGVVTAFWNIPGRPLFDTGAGHFLRSGQGGEDDLGMATAAQRVYTNIGACFSECIAPRPGRTDPLAPIDLEQCRRDCRDFPPDQDLRDLEAFLRSIPAPKFPGRPPRHAGFARGRQVFAQTCARCHSLQGPGAKVLSNDLVNPLEADPANATNACRALTTSWERGHIWQAFSSSRYKERAEAGLKGYRTMPLTGIWATAPLLHNQSIGTWATPTATPAERARGWEAAMWELLAPARQPHVDRLPVGLGNFPPGTPLTQVFSRDPATGKALCDDAVQNRGHHYGATLPEEDKAALILWLKYQ